MTMIVTGGCGFIGSHAVDALLEKGYDVTVWGLNCGKENISHVKGKVKIERIDVRDREAVKKAVDKNVEGILHLAALINVDESIDTPEPFWDVNVNGTFNVLEAARLAGVPKLVNMGTCEVYGNIPEGKADESHPTNPLSPYAASKFSAERYLLSYATTYSDTPSITLLRGFNQYGPRQNSGSRGAVIAKFIGRALNGKSPKVFGDGSQTRDYVYVEDTARGIAKALESDTKSGEIINLASGRDVSIKSIAEQISELAGLSKDKIEFVEGRPGELIRSCGDSSKAENLLGWKAETIFEEGLKKTYDWYKQSPDYRKR